jgi:hypothetical protein
VAYFAAQDQSGSLSIDLDPDDGEGPHSYFVTYWIGIRTTEAGSGITASCFCTDSLGVEAQNDAGTLDGSSSTSIQGIFAYDYDGTSVNPSAVFHFDINAFSPGGVMRYDYKINHNMIAGS